MARLYKALPVGIIEVESHRRETGSHLVSFHQNPFHFGRSSVDNEPHKRLILRKNRENCNKTNIFNSFAAHLIMNTALRLLRQAQEPRAQGPQLVEQTN
jgi:hypothetical protein